MMSQPQKIKKMKFFIIIQLIVSISVASADPSKVKTMDYSEIKLIVDSFKGKESEMETFFSALNNLNLSIYSTANEMLSIEQCVPFTQFVCENYDHRICPIIFERALKEEDKYIVRRLVYCLEVIEGKLIEGYIKERFEDEIDSVCAKKLVDSSSKNVKFNIRQMKKNPDGILPSEFYLPFSGEELLDAFEPLLPKE